MVDKKDKAILRKLAEKKAEAASKAVNKERIEMWRKLNQLERVKPMLWMNEIPWHELGIDEDTLECSSPFGREKEIELKMEMYQWEHMQLDMVVEDTIYCPLVIHDSGFGLEIKSHQTMTGGSGPIHSREWEPQIKEESDIEKIKPPVITYNKEATEHNYNRMVDIFGDILKVEKRGRTGFGYASWDDLVMWWGVQPALLDLVMRPEMIKAAMEKLTTAFISRLDQLEALNLFSLNNTNVRVGTGAYGYTDELPARGFDAKHVRPCDMWGMGTAQIFSVVSPEMHKEFSLDYERRIMDRFGLVYYGCCEPLHNKIDILKEIPNLRKISMSPWIDVEVGAAKIQDKYVFSYKPSPSIFADDDWKPEVVRKELRGFLEKTRGCHVEIIMKDITTVLNQPQRLWEWSRIADEVTAEFA